ncbi:hypothetical protein GQ457_02G037460 [Hibiscus cannabinus]
MQSVQDALEQKSLGQIVNTGNIDPCAMLISPEDDILGNNLFESLQTIGVFGKRKRMASTYQDDVQAFSVPKRREIVEAINEGIIQIGPGNWDDVGFSAVTNDEWLQLVFSQSFHIFITFH